MPKMTQAVADSAAAIYDSYQRRMGQVRQNPDLSAAGKQRAAAQIHVDHKARMEDLQNKFTGAAADTVASGARSLFGQTAAAGADAISVRDASDRAAQLTDPGAALSLYERAQNNGDDVLVRAILQHAYDNSGGLFGHAWNQVLATHAERNPGFAAQLNEMTDATAGDEFANAGHFFLATDPLLSGLHPHQIEQLAATREPAV